MNFIKEILSKIARPMCEVPGCGKAVRIHILPSKYCSPSHRTQMCRIKHREKDNQAALKEANKVTGLHILKPEVKP